ncbi:MAG TPA: ABC transporter permease [Bryobacteraceae bacterium]|nr:ABC transporter permease [Bryobacteraceae bacterium]
MRRELSVTFAWAALLLVLAFTAPAFFSPSNLRDLAVANAPNLLVAAGMSLVIIAGEIDISIGSQFAVLSVAAGVLAKSGMPMFLVVPATAIAGLALGALNGVLVSRLGIRSIVATLAAMIALRDALRWATGGAWIENLPGSFQWFGLGQRRGEVLLVATCALFYAAIAWALRNVSAGRFLYAVGSDKEAARLAGIPSARVLFGVFAAMGALTAIAAALNAVRFREIQSNTGMGLELKAIAAVVVGGASITGGRGTLTGTLLGLGLLATIGPALTYLGVSPYWEKAIQGAIILCSIALDVLPGKSSSRLKEATVAGA